MAFGYLPVDRDQQFLMPPSMRDWLPEDHLAWFVLDVVDRLDTSVLHERHPNNGVGRRAYDPDMLLALLIYSYSTGTRSSRQIERLCVVDVAFRVIAAGHAPDHTTIARFRQGHHEIAVQMFTDVLMLCAAAGLTRVGIIAIDGTKIAANASLKANRTRNSIEEEIRTIFENAAAVDADEDQTHGERRGDELPEELSDPRRRKTRLDAAVAELDARAQALTAQRAAVRAGQDEAWERRRRDATAAGRRPSGRPPAELELDLAIEAVADEEARLARKVQERADLEAAAAVAGRRVVGPKPQQPATSRGLRAAQRRLAKAREAADAAEPTTTGKTAGARPQHDKVNTTDIDSRIMKTPNGWVQGYNAQAAANLSGIVLAANVTQDPYDVGQCVPMMTNLQQNLATARIGEPVGVVLFDAGYLSEENITAEGPDRLIATGNAHKLRKTPPTGGPPPEGATPTEAMLHRLRTPEGSELYKHRQHTIETVFADTKEIRGFRRFTQRGLAAVNAEWKLEMAVHNIIKLFRIPQPI